MPGDPLARDVVDGVGVATGGADIIEQGHVLRLSVASDAEGSLQQHPRALAATMPVHGRSR